MHQTHDMLLGLLTTSYETLSAEIEPMDSRHMERGTPSVVLHVRGCPCLNE